MPVTVSTTHVAGDPGHPVDHDSIASAFAVATVTANYSMAALDAIVLASNTISVTLPALGTSGNGVIVGKRYTIKNVGIGTVTVLPPSGTIDGAGSFVMTVQYSSIDIVTDGTNWFTV